jgi:hypothetical protein
MTKEQLKAALDRVLAWPPEAQEVAIASLEAIEAQLHGAAALSDDDVAALERSADDVRCNRFASASSVRDVLDRFRHP